MELKYFEIKKRSTGTTLFKGDFATIKDAVDVALREGADLTGADLSDANLTGADFSGADLSGADLRDATLSGANLTGAEFSGAYLRNADLCWANLTGAEFSGATLSGADLRGAELSGAHFGGTLIYDEIITKAPLFIDEFGYSIRITDKKIKIGCQVHTTVAWRNFSDQEIEKMDGKRALNFWHKNKEKILALAEEHQKTGGE